MTVDDMKSLGDDSLKIDVTRDEKTDLANDSVGNYTTLNFLVDINIFGKILKNIYSKFDIKLSTLKIILGQFEKINFYDKNCLIIFSKDGF